MPIEGSFSSTLDIYSKLEFRGEDRWNAGSHNNTKWNKEENCLTLDQYGEVISYYESKVDDFNFYTSMTNLTVVTEDVTTNYGYLKLENGKTSGTRTIMIDLSKVNIYGIAYINWSGGAYSIPNIYVSLDNSTWEKITDYISNYDPGQLGTAYYKIKNTLRIGDDVSNAKLYIKQEFTSSDQRLYDFGIKICPEYKNSGYWISPPVPLSDLGIITSIYQSWSNSDTSFNLNCDSIFKVSANDGLTWRTIPEYQTFVGTNEQTKKTVLFKIEMATQTPQGSPTFNYIKFYYWARIFVNELECKENLSDKIPEINFKSLVTQTDATYYHFYNNNSFDKIIRLTQTNGDFSKTFIGVIISKPRITKLLTQEQIEVKVYDAKYLAQRILVNDFTPKLYHYHSSIVYGRTLAESVANLWKTYGDKRVYCEGSNSLIYVYDNLPYGDIYVDNRIKVKQTGTSYGTLFDLLNEICDDDNYEWSIIENDNNLISTYPLSLKLVPKDDSIIIRNITLNSQTNIIGIPNISSDDDISEIANVVIVPTQSRKTGYEQVMNLKQNTQIYYMQYTPICRTIQLSDGTTTYIDPKPQVYLYTGGQWVAKETVVDGSIQTSPSPKAFYNIEQKWIKLVDNPSADVINGIKIVYTVQIPSSIILKNEESINLFGEIHHYISSNNYSREEAYNVADNYLFEHALPVSPVTLETNQWKFNIGDYLNIYIPEQGIDQIMPVVEKKTTINGTVSKIELILNKAPVKDEQMIVDIFKRIKLLERKSDGVNEEPNTLYVNINENLGLKDIVIINGVKGVYL